MIHQSSSLTVSIRRARSSDRNKIAQIQIESIETLSVQDYTSKQIKCLTDYKKEYISYSNLGSTNETQTIFVAETNEEVIGFAALGYRNTIDAMFVCPKFARKGVGRQLLAAVESEAKIKGWKILTVKASLTGIPFYQACGYRVLGKTIIPLPDREKWLMFIPCCDLEKWLVTPNDAEKFVWDGWTAIGTTVNQVFNDLFL
ncbi:MAG: GNAT family N-acetyltransferase [Xenococcaceae cyanobacterium]